MQAADWMHNSRGPVPRSPTLLKTGSRYFPPFWYCQKTDMYSAVFLDVSLWCHAFDVTLADQTSYVPSSMTWLLAMPRVIIKHSLSLQRRLQNKHNTLFSNVLIYCQFFQFVMILSICHYNLHIYLYINLYIMNLYFWIKHI